MSKSGNSLPPNAVLERVSVRLEDARVALDRFQTLKSPVERLRAFRQFVRDSREVTFALQRMRSAAGSQFDAWYRPIQDEMRSDPLLQAFKDLRNRIEKQGEVGPGGLSIHVGKLNAKEIRYYFLPPRYAEEFFIGDQLGRSGWEIRRPDGRTEYRYVDLLDQWAVEVEYSFSEEPESHLGQDIRGKSLLEMAEMYWRYLSDLVESAEEEFGER